MGLRCSLLGHAFETDGVEREREQRGDEVVTVVREVETCGRCGERRVVSETTEVTSVIEPEEANVGESGMGPGTESEPRAEPDTGTGGDGSGDGAPGALDGIVDRAETGSRASTDADETPSHPRVDPGETEGGIEPPEDPAEEDAEIIDGVDDDGQSESDDRSPGKWPDDAPGEPTRPSAVTDEDGDEDEDGDTDRSGEPGEAADAPAGAAGDPRYVCGECGFAEPTADSPLREGDSCPECGAGWLSLAGGDR